ncbi:hypothetical protein FVE85_2418 [Porphyridium purpureum]|uniref:Uncharacterized protein n=1 Tax=Porphyridium purpureum TaxID=35688 RepID=A0A5J4Z0B4_PORPP|nr:hypothetical protein FVE85_2418 [Porphyridium purpureum]|eukprot:POR8397..scf209_3
MRCVKLQYMRVSLLRGKASAAKTLSRVMVPVVAVAVATMLMAQILAFRTKVRIRQGYVLGFSRMEECCAYGVSYNSILPLSRFAELENRNLALRQTCDPARAKLYGKALKFSVAENQR